jgi:hypothetical protein
VSFFESLQNSAFTESVLGSESVWAYPTILTLHTVGLAILVGASAVLHLRLLGVGAAIPLDRLRLLYSFIWPAFALNLASGVVLFITQAADRVTQPLFYIKLGSIAVALWLGERAKKTMFIRPERAPEERSRAFSGIAVSALACWTVAIIAGRLMAYYSGN